MSIIDSHETTLEGPGLTSATLARQAHPYGTPLYRRRRQAALPLPPAGWQCAAKRGIDIAVSLATLALAPLLLLVALAVRLDSPGPVLFRQRRIGLDGRPFTLLKFRTMHDHPTGRGGLRQACLHDPRVTRVGALLRHTSLDELPQLWNVLRGEMSLVGPRPHAPGTCAGGTPFEQVSERYPRRHRVRPGMTGLAQVRGWRGQTDTEDKLLCRLDSDLEYIATWSLWLDCVIMARTVATVLRMRNAY
ncbi:MAG TPA: sugar transferase [Acetobacteraceae bacterium]|nr:sugar transferase [Acetobacteraceae bacterium]